MWLMLISSGTASANRMRTVGTGRRATHQVAPATTSTSASAARSQGSGIRRGFWAAAAGRATALVSDPESALRANDRSRADWNRCSGFFSKQRRTMRSSVEDTGCP